MGELCNLTSEVFLDLDWNNSEANENLNVSGGQMRSDPPQKNENHFWGRVTMHLPAFFQKLKISNAFQGVQS